MRIVDVIQGSEAWEDLRRGVPTASCFDRIVTPAKGQLSASWRSYAAELIAQRIGVWDQAPPSYWMEWGTENEPYAVAAYEAMRNVTTMPVGFVWPDDHKRFGCSPDRIVNDGLLEVKCPKPETLIEYHALNELPNAYKPQVMGQLYITNLSWCDFVAYHPRMKPFILRVERDEKYIASLAVALHEFCDNLDEMHESLAGIEEYIDVSITDDYQPTNYEPMEGVDL